MWGGLGVGEWIIILLSGVLLIGYGWGYIRNRARAAELSAWLSEGLAPWGQVQPGSPLSGLASGGRLQVDPARSPFRRIHVTYVLAPRENWIFWILHRLWGKGDEIFVQADVRTAPKWEVSLHPADKGVPAPHIPHVGKVLQLRFREGQHLLYGRSEGGPLPEEQLRELVRVLTPYLREFVIRRSSPHILLRLDVSSSFALPARALWDMLAGLFRPREEG